MHFNGRSNFALFGSSLLLFLIIAEIAARLFVPAPLPWLLPQPVYESSASLIFRLRPNQSSYTADKPFHTNSMGLRGRETSWQKPPGTKRLLVLGDSVAAGFGVRVEDTLAAKLESLLNSSNSDDRWEVINASVPAYNTAQEVAYFHEVGHRFQPDLVILLFCWNDLADKTRVRVDEFGRIFDESVPLQESAWKRALASEDAYRLRNVLKQSRFFYFLTDRFRLLSMAFSPPLERKGQITILQGVDSPAIKQAWISIEHQLLRLVLFCTERRVSLLVAAAPMADQVARRYPDTKYQSVLKSICMRHKLVFVDPLESFQRASRNLFINYDDTHPNEAGHDLIARELYRKIAGSDQVRVLTQ